MATALNFLGNWLGTFTAPYFINPASLNWGPKYGYIWFGSNMLVAVFVWFYLPETRDRTLEEIHEMFEAKVPSRRFKTYVCVGVEEYHAEVMGDGSGFDLKKRNNAAKTDTKADAEHVEAA